ncbi:MAG: VWA domain-containing protein [Lachnospiraceae bacterium]|nr:VWA domain-containing protein [Lachnospiraceae bacterium]
MRKTLLNRIRRILRNRRLRRMMTRVISIVAALVVFVTTYALVLPAITMEREADCGIEAHQHDDSCYERQLVCDIPEDPGHRHDDACYRAESVLKCVTAEHTHGEACYDEEGNLLCEQAEHTHDASCYEEERELICGLEESAGHQHDDSCYENVLVCGKEVHVHSEDCYHQEPVEEEETYSEEDEVPEEDMYHEEYAVPEEEQNQYVDEPADEPDEDPAQTPADAETYGPGGSSGTEGDAGAAQQDGEGASGRTGNEPVQEGGAEVYIPEAEAAPEVPLAAPLVPELEPLDFRTLLNSHTGIYYYHVQPGEVVENSAQITGWKKVTADTELGEKDLLRVYLAYTLPAGAVNTTNAVVRYRLPGNLHLTDDQVKAINGTENGIAAQYVDYGTLTLTDPDNYHKYLGAEAVEGTRTPDQDEEAYLAAGGADGNGQEYISAVVRVENIGDTGSGDRTGQDLLFTFVPYTVFKNRHEYDGNGQQTGTGVKVRGWFSLDFNMGQVDFDEVNVDGDREIRTADVVFAEKDSALQIEEISTGLRLVRAADPGTEENPEAADPDRMPEEGLEDPAEQAAEAEGAGSADPAEDGNAPGGEAAEENAAADGDKDPENAENEDKLIKLFDKSEEDSKKDSDKEDPDKKDPDKKDADENSEKDALAEIMPAMSFEDTIRVSTGRPAGAETKGSGGTVADAADALPKKANVTVRVEADEGTFPAGTTMVLAAVKDLDAVAETVQETVENGSSESGAGHTDSHGAGADAASGQAGKAAGSGKDGSGAPSGNTGLRTYGFQAVDISFRDADGNEIEPAKPVRVAMTSEIVEQVRREQTEDLATAVADPMVVHIDDNGNVETMDLIAPEEIEPAQGRTEEELREEAEAEAAARKEEKEKEAEAADQAEKKAGGETEAEKTEAADKDVTDAVDKEAAGKEERKEGTASEQAGNTEAPAASGSEDTEAGEAEPADRPETIEDKEEQETDRKADPAEGQGEAPVDTEPANPGTSRNVPSALQTVAFNTESFSVYVIVYTVDFEYTVNGKSYQFSLPGGGFVSFTDLVEVLGITGDTNSEKNGDENGVETAEDADDTAGGNAASEAAEENGVNTDTNTALTLGDVEVSEATRKFVADVASVEFSSPSLVDVSRVDSNTTVGQIKETRGLECAYSAELTEEQIAEINAQTIKAGDWALISVQPFTSEETLTVTMKDGDQFAVKVTDAQLKATVISVSGETYEVIVMYDDNAQIPEGASLEITEFVEDSKEYQAAREALVDKKQSEDSAFDDREFGVAAFDLSILDVDGNQVEPKAVVDVFMKMKSLPEETVEEDVQYSFEIHHLNESFGDVTVETVASVIDGSIQIEKEIVQAEFQLESFSTFTISWNRRGTNDNTTDLRWRYRQNYWDQYTARAFLTVDYVDESGYAISRPNGVGYTIDNDNFYDGAEYTVNIGNVLGRSVDNYTYRRAYITDSDGQKLTVTSLKAERHGNTSTITYYNESEVVKSASYTGTVRHDFGEDGLDMTIEYEKNNNFTTIHYGYMDGDTFVEFDEQPEPTNTSTSFGWAHLIYDFAGTDDQGLHVDWKYIGTYYHTSETTNPQQGGTAMQPILRYNRINNKDAWRYYDGAIDTYGPVRQDQNWHEVADGSDIYVVYEKPVIPTGGAPSPSENSPQPDTPYILKESTPNTDGTNTLSLSVTGSRKPMITEKVADVIVILDLSSSMRRDIGSQTAYDNNYQTVTNSRYYQAKQAVQKLADRLYAVNGTDGEQYRMGLVTFSNKATIRQTPTEDKDTFQSVLDGITRYEGSGTNWEHSLQLANQMAVASDRATYIVFITDGEPSVRQTRGNLTNEQLSGVNGTGNPGQEGDIFHGGRSGGRFYDDGGWGADTTTPDFRDYFGSATFGGLRNNTIWDARNRNAAVDEVASILGHNKGFYAIGVSSEVNYLGDFTSAGGVDANHYKLVTSPTAFDEVIDDILEELDINGISGQANVKIYDGITDLTQTISKVNQKEGRLIGVDGNFVYYKSTAPTNWSTWTAAQKAAYALGVEYADSSETPTEYASYTQDEIDAYNLGKSISFSEWTSREADGCAAAVYNTVTGAVEWNMGQKFMLEDGVTYKVSFICWPSQEAYDIIAKLENGTITFGDTDLYPQEIWDQFEGDATNGYRVKTNEEGANTKYSKATNVNGTVTVGDEQEPLEFQHVPPMPLDKDKLNVAKTWQASRIDSQTPESVILQVVGDDELYKQFDITPTEMVDGSETPNKGRSENIYISCGHLKVNKTTGEVVIYESGHDFTLREVEENSRHWDLDASICRPMKINTEETMLVLVEGDDIPATMPGNADYYKSGGDEYYRIDGKVYRDTKDWADITGMNTRRSFLDLSKEVLVDNEVWAETVDEVFTYKIKIDVDPITLSWDPNLEKYIIISTRDANGTILPSSILEIIDGEYTPTAMLPSECGFDESNNARYLVAENGVEFYLSIKNGWSVRFLNLPAGTTYSIEEVLSEDSNYDFNNVRLETRKDSSSTNPLSSDTYTTVRLEGRIAETSTLYKVVYQNKAKTKEVQILKTGQDASTPLGGAVFDLYTESAYTSDPQGMPYKANLVSSSQAETKGKIDLGELPVGKYYLVETKAPDGYNMRTDPVVITVSRIAVTYSDGTTLSQSGAGISQIGDVYQLKVTNDEGVALPNTGGPGTRLFTILGSLLILGAGVLLWRRQRLF